LLVEQSGSLHKGGGFDFASKAKAEPLSLSSMADQDEGPVFVTQPVNVGAGEQCLPNVMEF
jgi:hypothetical protein